MQKRPEARLQTPINNTLIDTCNSKGWKADANWNKPLIADFNHPDEVQDRLAANRQPMNPTELLKPKQAKG